MNINHEFPHLSQISSHDVGNNPKKAETRPMDGNTLTPKVLTNIINIHQNREKLQSHFTGKI